MSHRCCPGDMRGYSVNRCVSWKNSQAWIRWRPPFLRCRAERLPHPTDLYLNWEIFRNTKTAGYYLSLPASIFIVQIYLLILVLCKLLNLVLRIQWSRQTSYGWTLLHEYAKKIINSSEKTHEQDTFMNKSKVVFFIYLFFFKDTLWSTFLWRGSWCLHGGDLWWK